VRKYCSHIWVVGVASMIFGATFPLLCDGQLYFLSVALGMALIFFGSVHYARSAKTRFLWEFIFGLGLTNLQDEILPFFIDHDPTKVNLSEYLFALCTLLITFRRYKLKKEVWEKSLR